MLGWNLGHTGSSLEKGMVNPEKDSARSLHPIRNTRSKGGIQQKL